MLNKLVLASHNQGKLKEFAALLSLLQIELVPQSQFTISSCPEPHLTFVENALAKARYASRLSGLPALADDSGLCVEVLNGAPGILSARLAGEQATDAENNAELIHRLQGCQNRRAWYYAVLVLVQHAHDPQPLIADGMWYGLVNDLPQGQNGFGYDPHFYLVPEACTVAQLSTVEKNQKSHRAQAMQSLVQKLKQRNEGQWEQP